MEIIKISHPYEYSEIIQQPIVLVLGFFDGVHRGHQRVIKQAEIEAETRELPLVVMTFDRHPKILYQDIKADDYQYLTLTSRKMALFEALGVDYCYLIEFSKAFGSLAPQTFVDQYIVGLNAEVVVAGFDYTYGPAEYANMTTLPEHAKGRFEVINVPEYQEQGHKIGTRFIVEDIKNGQMEAANQELGYPFQTQGEVIHGFKRGREIGYPTANIKHHPQQLVPKIGVYVTAVEVDNHWYPAMTSIGYNVTFDDVKDLSIEAYILDFDEMIYGKTLRVHWYYYLRDELKFANVEQLIAQLDQDLIDTRAYFEKHPERLDESKRRTFYE
ncbi:riboflavin biosynthesis protein RibF [Aerococcaceae bacterium DSM 111020]|nr:riboflavin biosynthesis protein RibF [Aerococcaceae bacterium DSM 111020]